MATQLYDFAEIMMKRDFFNPDLKIYDKVRIINTNNIDFLNKEGIIEGVVSLHLMCCYLVRLNEELEIPSLGIKVRSVSIPSLCLEKLGPKE